MVVSRRESFSILQNRSKKKYKQIVIGMDDSLVMRETGTNTFAQQIYKLYFHINASKRRNRWIMNNLWESTATAENTNQ